MDVAGASAEQIARAVCAGEVSRTEVIERTLARIEDRNPAVNAFAWVRSDDALADAKAADAEHATRMLEGVPFTIKELLPVAGAPHEMGSRAFAGRRADADAFVVQRLKAAGAIPVGTTTASEFGSRPTTESDAHGITRNPWNPERTSGGSSGGAGVSAALGFAPLNQGSDAGGSVRIPSSCCGVFGLKTTRGRVSFGPLSSEEWGGVDTIGPITRTVRDAALFLDAVAGPATGDPYHAPLPELTFLSATEEEPALRIAVAFERDGEAVEQQTKDAVRATAGLLAGMGHTVEEAQPDLQPLEIPWVKLTTVGIAATEGIDDRMDLLEERTRVITDVAKFVTATDYVRAQKFMHRAARAVATFFEHHDLLLTPTLSRPGPPIGEMGEDIVQAWDLHYRNWLCWTWPFNATGQPAASVPAGFTTDGLPIGVQLVGGMGAERAILSVAAQLERARPWSQMRPPIW